MEVDELKKILKPLGFTIQIRNYSHGRHGFIKHISTKKVMSGNVFSPEALKIWQPAIDIVKGVNMVTQDSDKVYGLKF